MVTAADFNARVEAMLRNRLLSESRPPQGAGRPRHKWRITIKRRDLREWLVYVSDGCVNAIPAAMRNDFFPTATRLFLHPFLQVTAPDRELREFGSFVRVPDGQRPPAFRTRDMWRLDLFRASVIVSGARPFTADVLLPILPLLPPPTTLVGLLSEIGFRQTLASLGLQERFALQPLRPPFTVSAGRFPVNLDGTEQFRLAWLYLAREPGGNPANDALFVQQRCFWNLAAFQLLEDEALLSLPPVLQASGDIGNLTALAIFEMLLDSARVRWWTR